MWNPFNRNTISNSSASKRSLQLITQKGMPFAYVEAYKALRTNLNFLTSSTGARAIVAMSTLSSSPARSRKRQSPMCRSIWRWL